MPQTRDADRYRKAATDALKVLDWCIWYFKYENQGEIATRLEQNRSYIRKQLTGEPEETLRAKRKAPAPKNALRANPLRKTLQAIGRSGSRALDFARR
jgi:hypothetical protein